MPQGFSVVTRATLLYSLWYPNLIPLDPAAIRQVVRSHQPFAFDRLYGAFPEQVVEADAKAVVERSADR